MNELAKINACAKRPIDIWTNYLYYPLSIRLVYAIRQTKVSPNAITLFSFFLALCGCACYSVGSRSAVIVGLVLVQVSYVFDCADGQLARYRKQYSLIGGWMDQVADRVKEFAVYFSLAIGYTRFHQGATTIWMWAMIALFTLYLLEYYGQIPMKRTPKSAAAETAAATSAPAVSTSSLTGGNDTFGKMQAIRGLVPFRGFIIGEQYFTMLVFIALGAIYPFFVFVACMGLTMSVYRPVIQFIKLRRSAQ